MPTVFIPNKSAHDFSPAKKFGTLSYVTVGSIDRFKVNTLYRIFMEAMEDAVHEDFVMVSSLPILVAIPSMIMARRFGIVHFLMFRPNDNSYMERTVDVDSMLLSPLSDEDTGPVGEEEYDSK